MELKASIRIGKNGITDGVIEEIREQLKKKKVVKIKFLKNTDRKNLREKVKRIASEVNADIADIRGFTTVLKKK